jgi:membrane associated rhomboid family serine protease
MPPRRPDLRELLGRLPVVSLGIAATSLLVCLVVQLGFASPLAEGRLLVRQAIDHVISHPSLEVSPRLVPAVRHALPTFEGNEMFAFLRDGKTTAEQSTLDVLTSRSFDRLDSHPYRALGLVPAQGGWLGFATHPFVHGGWIHAFLTCLLLLAAGPLLEAVWGRRLFGAASALSVLAGALVFRLAHSDLDRALVGGGALVSGLVAAALVRFWNQEVDLAGWLEPLASLELRVPAWSLAAGWAVYQAALVWAAGGDLPGGLQNAQGITASLAAAAAGAGIAYGLAQSGMEARFGSRLAPAAPRTASGRFDIEKVKRARARGDIETAFQILRAETRRSARNRDLVLLFWEIAVEHDQTEAAAPAMLQLIREELRRGALDAAVSQWRRLGERVPGALLDPANLLKLLPLIKSKLGDDAAVLALHQAVDPANRGFTPELGAEIARVAAEIEPEVARKAATRALQAKAIAPELASEMSALVTRLTPRQDDDEMGEVPAVAAASFDDDDDCDRSAFGAVDDLSADPPAKDEAKQEPAAKPPPAAPAEATPAEAAPAEATAEAAPEAVAAAADAAPAPLLPKVRAAGAVPLSLGEDELMIYVSGKGPSKLAYSRIKAVSLAAVRGLGPKPVVLLDLLLSHPEPGEGPLLLVRLRSDEYDPRKLVPSAAGALEALLALAEELLKRTRGVPLPDEAAARGRPLRKFDTLEAYSREVLRASPAEPAG